MAGPLDERRALLQGLIERGDRARAVLKQLEQLEIAIAGLELPDLSAPSSSRPPIGSSERRTCALPGCGQTFIRAPGTRKQYCSTRCRNTANSRSRSPRQRRQRAASDGAEAPAEADGASLPSRGLDLSVPAEADAPGERQDQGGGQGEAAAGAGLILDAGVIRCFTNDLTIRSAGAEERAGFVGGGQEDLAVDDLAGRAREGDAGGVCEDARPLEGLGRIDLRPAPGDHALHGQDGHPGGAFDHDLIVAVDEATVAEVEQAPDEGVVGAVAVGANGECHEDDLQADAAGQAAIASPAGQLPYRRRAVACAGEQREVPLRDRCARCGEPIDRATRRSSSYCSDDCREEGRQSILQARKAGDPWQFALHPLLYGRLGGRVEDVRLFPPGRERLEQQQRAHAGV
jgi:hypothetical protein